MTDLSKTKVLINASTLIVGGGIQVGVSLIEYLNGCISKRFDFLYVVSKGIYENLSSDIKNNPRVILIEDSPARIISGSLSRKRLLSIEDDFKPDLIYSIGFPSYVRFKNAEVGRYTNPWEIFDAKDARKLLSFHEKIKLFLKTQYRLYWAKKSNYYETQTETAKEAIIRTLSIDEKRIKVLSNTINDVFLCKSEKKDLILNKYIFCLAAPHPHKNIQMIPHVADQLRKNGKYYKFILTLPEDSTLWSKIKLKSEKLGVQAYIENVGVLRIYDCLEWYKKSFLVFMPTLLEVFSATYLESMAMRRPILTSDMDFSREICGNAAFYFDPGSVNDAATAIDTIYQDTQLRKELVDRGTKRLKSFPNSEEKNEKLLDWFNEIINEKR